MNMGMLLMNMGKPQKFFLLNSQLPDFVEFQQIYQ